jgi:hypothetical protein
MKHDSQVALALSGLSLILLLPSIRLRVSSIISNPIVAGLFVGTMVMLYVEGYMLVSIVLIMVTLYLLQGYSVPTKREHFTYSDVIDSVATIPEQPVSYGPDSVDLDIANRRVSPQALPEVPVQPTLLTYPPTEYALWSMSGP